jgi:glutathione S-transferase
MTRRLYDLAAADESVRFSPYCWRAKLALAHKNLSYETIPWRFTDKDAILFSGQDKVPVLVDGDQVISDSQAIAEYLEATYLNEPPLYGDPPARALTYFVKSWTETRLHPAISQIIMPDIFERLAEQDKDYFRRTREARLGHGFAELVAQRDESIRVFQIILQPLLATLEKQTFVAGDAPGYADHIVFGALQWARLMSSTPLFDEASPLIHWMRSVLDTYGLQ